MEINNPDTWATHCAIMQKSHRENKQSTICRKQDLFYYYYLLSLKKKMEMFSDTQTLLQIILLSLGAGKLPCSFQKYSLNAERDKPLGLYNISTRPSQLQQCLCRGSVSVPTLDQTKATLNLP